jgi:FtsP/CotA-like multicopper oxidase with cupredoxin domain
MFKVVALDGNPVPTPADVPVLWIGTAERISAIVDMDHPGVWVLGDLADDDRGNGMGIVIEYANSGREPQWSAPRPLKWDYTRFGKHVCFCLSFRCLLLSIFPRAGARGSLRHALQDKRLILSVV